MSSDPTPDEGAAPSSSLTVEELKDEWFRHHLRALREVQALHARAFDALMRAVEERIGTTKKDGV
jgi:hypothetical protein